MPPYLVKKLDRSAQHNVGQGNAVIVFANSVADARAMARALATGDSDAAWDEATATELVAGTDLEGYRLKVRILDSVPVVDLVVEGIAAATVDSIAALMVTALLTTGINAGAAYDSGSNILTISSIGDNIGDKIVQVEFVPPTTMPGADKAPIPDFVGAIVDEGIAGAVLTVQLGSDAVVVPNVAALVRA